ncbi:MAG: DNA cytosine methyltransferase [Erythrobacter sp.]|nr:DNA cytosine methyltransferase [Erythrobacter sp.]MDZ4273058.1 DNA cytosine methyltransferase [Erythrobacter sp.]
MAVHRFYEFFAGGGMARAGLGEGWECLFANDIDLKKAATYVENWGRGAMVAADVKSLTTRQLPDVPDLIWASFPCQDISLAGGGAGLKGERSGTFWPFWRLVNELVEEGRAPSIVVLENVAATLTSHGGKDFEALCGAIVDSGYRVGARVIDAVDFVPQSRPRMFLIAVRSDIEIPSKLVEASGSLAHIDKRVATAFDRMAGRSEMGGILSAWVNWALPNRSKPPLRLDQIIEKEPSTVKWHSAEETASLVAQMSELNRRKLQQASEAGNRMIGTAYRRTRLQSGEKQVRTEVRFDGIAGCLRTPAGGSSRQIVIEVNGSKVRSRLMTPREAARLMGLPDSYRLPPAYNEAYHLMGDGVAVAVVDYLARNLFEPLLERSWRLKQAA